MQVPYAVNIVLNSSCTEIRHGLKERLSRSASLSKCREFMCLSLAQLHIFSLGPHPHAKRKKAERRCEAEWCFRVCNLSCSPDLESSPVFFILPSCFCSQLFSAKQNLLPTPGFNTMTARMGLHQKVLCNTNYEY